MATAYSDLILSRYKAPGFRGVLEPCDFSGEADNSLCGDQLRIDIRLDGGSTVKAAAFSGSGCAVSIAAADLLVEMIHGKTVQQIQDLVAEDILALLNAPVSPGRLPCATLPLRALRALLARAASRPLHPGG